MPRPALQVPVLLDWIASRIQAATRQAVRDKAEHLAWCLHLSYFLLRRHRQPLSYGIIPGRSLQDQFNYASSFRSEELKRGLGGSTGKYEKYLALFWDFLPGNQGYSRTRGITKAYLLNKSTSDALTTFWRSEEPGVVIDRETGEQLTAAELPKNGVCRTSFSEITVTSLLTFDLDRLNELIEAEEASTGDGSKLHMSERRRRVRSLRLLYLVRKWVLSFGGVPNLYQDYQDEPSTGNGRLTGIGELHLQTLKKSARRLLYRGSGWWDFDFRACHPTIMLSLARGYGLEMPAWSDYLDAREELNARIAEDVEVPVGKMKRVMNSLLYGQPLSTSPYSSLRTLIGPEAVQLLWEQDYFLWLRDELKEAREVIVQHHLQGDHVVNAVGKRCSVFIDTPSGQRRKVPTRKLLAHILTGYEAWALNLVCKGFDDVRVLMHDGWVSAKGRNISELEKLIRFQSVASFGFQLSLCIKGEQFL